MLPLNEVINDVKTWTGYIAEDSGAIPAGLESAVGYLQTLAAILEKVDAPNFQNNMQNLRDWLERRGYFEVPKKRNSNKTKRRSKRSGMDNGNDHE